MKHDVPLWEKVTLTLDEASDYSGIGINKIRDISEQNECDFVLWVGNKRLIKRKPFVEYLEKCYSL